MNAITNFLETKLVPFSEKLSKNKYLGAISGGFAVLLPVTMIGAIFSLLANLNIAPYQEFITNIGLKPILAFPPTVTTDMTAIYASFGIGRALCTNLNHEGDSSMCGLITLFVFLLLIPLGATTTLASGELVAVQGVLNVSQLGAQGLFSAMVLGIIVPTIYCKLLDKKLMIKMPEQVPPVISKSFSALIPGFIIAIIFIFVRYGFSITSFGSFNSFIYDMLRTPLANLGASPLTFLVFILFASMMWFFGIHGGMVVMPFMGLLYTQVGLENLQALAAGETPPNILTQANWSLYSSLGGIGGTIGLCVFMAFFAKSKRYKTIGKIALPASLCGINEPITFGVPMVLNTVLLAPFILTPMITFLISYGLSVVGWLPYPNGVAVSLGTPVVLSGFLSCGWQASILQIVLIGVQFMVYFPFIKSLDKKAFAEEQEEV